MTNVFPPVFKVRQRYVHPCVADVAQAVRFEMAKLPLDNLEGKRIAITAGSRGIPNIVLILSTIVEVLRGAGADPFIVPTMGSHGGGTATGQKKYLAGYGITEKSVGCAIRGEMKTRVIGDDDGTPIRFSKLLWDTDQVLVVGRVKAHTGFVAEIESGLCKMAAIGGGRYEGAQTVHGRAQVVGMEAAILAVARCVLDHRKVLGGLALIDNADHETAVIEAVRADSTEGFIEHERQLLARSKQLLAQPPFPEVDLLYLYEMGKNVSGSGSDPNVMGKKPGGWRFRELPRDGQATIGHVCCSSLTEKSNGNATGIRLHDSVTQRLVDRVDWDVTRINAETGGAQQMIEQPPTFPNDQLMLDAALAGLPHRDGGPIVMLAKNTGELRVLYVSENMLNTARSRDDLEVLSGPEQVVFHEGFLELNYASNTAHV